MFRASQVALVVKNTPAHPGDVRDSRHTGSSPGSERSTGGGNPLQYSCLENPMDRGAWLAIVHGVTKSLTHDWSDLAWTQEIIYLDYWAFCVQSLSPVGLFATLWTVACQVPLSMEFSRQKYWSGLPFPPLGDLSDQGSNPCLLCLPHWQVSSLALMPPGKFFGVAQTVKCLSTMQET